MKPTISDTELRDAVVKELESDREILVPKHISVTAVDGAVTLGGHVIRSQRVARSSHDACVV